MMFKRQVKLLWKKPLLLISLIVLIISGFVMLGDFIYIKKSNTRVHHFVQSDFSHENLNCWVSMEIPIRSDGNLNCWDQGDGTWGAQYDIYVHNDTKLPFDQWTLKIIFPDDIRVDSYWNCNYSADEQSLDITPVGEAMNLTVGSLNKVKVGFVIYSKELIDTAVFAFEGKFIREFLKSKIFIAAFIIACISFVFCVAFLFAYELVERKEKVSQKQIRDVLRLCAKFIDTRDEYTAKHSENVAEYSRIIAKELGLDEKEQQNMYYIGMMHDIGKVLIPREILCKKGSLTDDEWKEMKRHTTYGAEVLKTFNSIPNIFEAALYHHERFDGNGYEGGMKGEDIPLVARIICVADSYDAMSTNRSYRDALPEETILQELLNNSGTQFDPKIVEVMVNLIKSGKLKNR